MSRLAYEGSIERERRDYDAVDLEGAFMAVACADDTEINIRLYEDAERRAMLDLIGAAQRTHARV